MASGRFGALLCVAILLLSGVASLAAPHGAQCRLNGTEAGGDLRGPSDPERGCQAGGGGRLGDDPGTGGGAGGEGEGGSARRAGDEPSGGSGRRAMMRECWIDQKDGPREVYWGTMQQRP